MKRLLFLTLVMMSLLICGAAFAADPTGTYVNKAGTIVIEKSDRAFLVKVKFKNGHTSEYVTDRQNNDWIERDVVKKAENAYYVKIKSAKGDCDYEGLTILQGSELTVDDDLMYLIFSISLDNDGITPNIPMVSGGGQCGYMERAKFKKK
ncbi:MAG: hypothetical protein LBS65_03260 [Desulfovibrio sp.]|jgi:hypothetical protein|nr:hypothetical protein [Desulfovibrio sp.]